MNKALFLLSLFTFGSSISAMETNKPNPGDVAIKNHPNAWLAKQWRTPERICMGPGLDRAARQGRAMRARRVALTSSDRSGPT